MLSTSHPDYQDKRGKTLANNGTLDYNVKVNQGREGSNSPDCIYQPTFIMTRITRTKTEQFVVDIAHAFAQYGVKYESSQEDDKYRRLNLYSNMIESIQENWDDIVDTFKYLEDFYND